MIVTLYTSQVETEVKGRGGTKGKGMGGIQKSTIGRTDSTDSIIFSISWYRSTEEPKEWRRRRRSNRDRL